MGGGVDRNIGIVQPFLLSSIPVINAPTQRQRGARSNIWVRQRTQKKYLCLEKSDRNLVVEEHMLWVQYGLESKVIGTLWLRINGDENQTTFLPLEKNALRLDFPFNDRQILTNLNS